jgi:polar amino acid transport system substrate-binding protein
MIRMPRRFAKLLWAPVLAGALLLSGCTGSSSKAATAQDSQLSKVIKRGTLRVAALPDFPPYSSQTAGGQFDGYEVDVAKDLAKALGVKLQLVSTDGTSRLPLLKTDRVDVNISAWTSTNERAKSVGFTLPYVAHGASLLFRKNNPIKSYADLAGKSVSVARGSTNDTIVTNDFPTAKVVRFETIADAIAALKAGKVDACMEDAVTVQAAADKDPSVEALKADPLDPALISMGVLPGDQVWINYLNNFIRNLIASGEDQKLYAKWLHGNLPAIVGTSPQQPTS